jgi:integrase
VIYTAPGGQRVEKNFKDEAKAKAYHRELLTKASIGGTAGLVLDRVMRAEYFAARDLLGDVPLTTAVRFYLKHQPNEQTSTPLMDLQKRFLDDKRRTGRAVRTIEALDSALGLFLAKSPATIAADFTQDVVREYLDGLQAPPLTIRTHRARLSAFGEWLARRGFIPDNPVRHIEVAKYDPRPPRILTPEEAETLMRRAQEYRDGMFAPMFAVALFAGLRHGELMRLTWADVHLDGDSPIIRVGQGKIRGRRAVRIVPIEPNLLSWLKWAKAKNLALVCPSSDARKVREAVPWQTDITRHSWISYRLALVNDEARVAREAGNSPDVIYRHYFQLVNVPAANDYFKVPNFSRFQ